MILTKCKMALNLYDSFSQLSNRYTKMITRFLQNIKFSRKNSNPLAICKYQGRFKKYKILCSICKINLTKTVSFNKKK